ncbi:FHA domain-containing protein [Pseudarthrobacter sp. fls2-241-R2A-168]|uniref:FHA domain-containing protein n=1 Tax=Pseudarthrobacter sp. fls2-241-R2A-168 TaxID=3040304 RepID=UPI00255584EF|nr:FHA domain-containing protein [Pseudarthrobacter sp. fls2-241-R2A-168]
MTAVSYIPGTWLGIVRSHTVVLLEPDTKPALIAALWGLLESRPEVHEVLHAVTSSSGGSLANIPSFGILDFQGPLRVFLRGDLDVTVQSADGPVKLNGRDVTTWTERRLDQSGLCRLVIPAAGRSVDPEPKSAHAVLPDLPLAEGVVLLQSLVLTLGAEASGAARPAPAAVEPAVAAGTAAAAPAAADPAAPVFVAPEAPTSAVPGPVIEASEEADLPEITVAPEHGASAETVYAVIDEDFEDDGLAETDAAPESGADPDSGVDPDPEAAPATDAGPATDTGLSAAREDTTSSASEQPVASEMTSSYDHLWERTVVRRIEDAAVREEPQPADQPEPQAQDPEAAELRAVEDQAVEQQVAGESSESGPADTPARPEVSPATAGAPPAVVLEAPSAGSPNSAPMAPTSGLIDSVPWRTAAGGSSEPAPPSAVPAPMLSAAPSTASVAPTPAAPVVSVPVAPAPEANHAEYDADHDGQTVMKGSLKGMAARPVRTVTNSSEAAGPLVLARLCPQDHPNPPTSATCAACGAGLLPDAVQVARPRLGRMRISTGELVDLDQSLVIGRQPSVSRVQGGVMPRLVQVASPGGDISRSHVEVRLEGWHVMLCDLKATNGTVLVREGQPPRRLAQNEMAILLDGDIAELGDNISLRFEEIP